MGMGLALRIRISADPQFSVGMQLISAWFESRGCAHLMYAIPHVALTMLFVLELLCEFRHRGLALSFEPRLG